MRSTWLQQYAADDKVVKVIEIYKPFRAIV